MKKEKEKEKLEKIEVLNEQEIIDNAIETNKKNYMRKITMGIGFSLSFNLDSEKKVSEDIWKISREYLKVYHLVNIKSKEKIEDAFELNNAIFSSRLPSKSYQYNGESLDKLYFDILSSLKSVNNDGEKLSIKSLAKLMSYKENVLKEKMDFNDLNHGIKEEIEKNINALKIETIEGYKRKISRENHKYIDNILLDNKDNYETHKRDMNLIDGYLKNNKTLKSKIKNQQITKKILLDMIKFMSLKETLKYVKIEKIQELGQEELEKNFTYAELYELYKDDKYKVKLQKTKAEYKNLYENINKKSDLNDGEILLLNNKNILNVKNIIEYITRLEDKTINKEFIIKKGMLEYPYNFIFEKIVNEIRENLKIKKEFKISQVLKSNEKTIKTDTQMTM